MLETSVLNCSSLELLRVKTDYSNLNPIVTANSDFTSFNWAMASSERG